MAKINFKKVLSFLMALCMIMSLFTCVSILPASASSSDTKMLYVHSTSSANFFGYRSKSGGFAKATKYRLSLDWENINSAPFGDSTFTFYAYSGAWKKVNSSSLTTEWKVTSYELANGTHYDIDFTTSSPSELREFVLYFGDINKNISNMEFKTANWVLYTRDANDNLTDTGLMPTFGSVSFRDASDNAMNTYLDKYTATDRGQIWRKYRSSESEFVDIPAGYFDIKSTEPDEPEVPGEPDSYDDGDAKTVRFVSGKASYLHYYNENRTLAAGGYELGFDWNTVYGEGAYLKLMVGGEVVLENSFGTESEELLTDNGYFAEDAYSASDFTRKVYFELAEDTTGIEIIIGASDGTTSMYVANPYIKSFDLDAGDVTGNNLINNITASTYYESGLDETNNKMWNREGGYNSAKVKSVRLLGYDADAFNGADIGRRVTFNSTDWRLLRYHDYYDTGIESGKTYKIVLDYRKFSDVDLDFIVKFDSTSVSGTKEIDTVNRKLYYTFTATSSNPYNFNITIGNQDYLGIASIGHIAMYEVDAEGNTTGNSLIDDINKFTLDFTTSSTEYDRVWNTRGYTSADNGIYTDAIPAGYFSANTAADKMVYFPAGEDGWQVLAYKDANTYMLAGTYQLTIDVNKLAGEPTVQLLTGTSIGDTVSATSVTNEGAHYTYTFELASKARGVGILLGNYGEGTDMAAMFKCPALYRVVDGAVVGENLIEPINSNTVVLKTGTSRANAANARWTSLNYTSARIKLLDISEDAFAGDVITTGTPYMVTFPQGQTWKIAEYNDAYLTLVNGKTYVFTIDERDVTGAPTVALYNTSNNNISTFASDFTDEKNGTTRTITFTMNATVSGVRIRVGNYSDALDVSGKYANAKLVEAGSDTNLIAGFSSDTFASSAENRKWRKAGQASSGNISTFYTSAIPEGYFENELTDKMFYISDITTNASYGNTIVNTGAVVEAGKTYTAELDWIAYAGLDPAIRATYKNTTGEWSSLGFADFTGNMGHYTATFTMPDDAATDSIFNIQIGVGADIKDDNFFNYGRGSVYFGNFSLKAEGSDVNILTNADLEFANEGDFTNTIAWNIGVSKNNGSRDMYGDLKVLEQPENFFTEEGAAAQKQVKIDGGDYDYLRQDLVLESNTKYRLTYKALFVNAESSAYIQLVNAANEYGTPTFSYSNYDVDTRTNTMEFTTFADMREVHQNTVLSFYIGRNGYDVKLNIADVKLYKVDENGNTVGGNLINNGGFFFGDGVKLENLASETSDSRSTGAVELLGWYIYGTFQGNNSVEVTDITADSFPAAGPTYAEQLVVIRKVLLNILTSSEKFIDANEDGKVDLRDLVRVKKLAVNAAGYVDKAETWKDKYLTGSNATDSSLYQGTVYYIDAVNGSDSNNGKSAETAWKSLSKAASVSSGNTVLFKAGQTWRPSSNSSSDVFTTKSGVVYGAYGTGAKPQILGSAYNYATRTWEQVSTNVWKTNVGSESAGVVVYNGGELIGTMTKTKDDVATANIGDFCHYKVVDNVISSTDNYIYVNCPQNPATYWNDIEIGVYRTVVDLKSNVTFDNIAVMYTGYHGIATGAGVSNITISNCIVSYIGGSYNDKNRLGNGIQFGISGSNLKVVNTYVSECFDAGLTFQTWESINGAGYWREIEFSNNLVENCHYSFEWFGITGTEFTNIYVDNNIFKGAGYGWSYDERIGYGEDLGVIQVSHFRAGSNNSYYDDMTNFQFTNNILDSSKRNLVYWYWKHEQDVDLKDNMFIATGNSFYQRSGCEDYIIQYIDETRVAGCSNSKVLEALKKFENTDAPTGDAEFIYDEQHVIIE